MYKRQGLLPASGEIIYLGERQGAARQVEKRVRQGITLVPEKRELFGEMSVADNLLPVSYTHLDVYKRQDRRLLYSFDNFNFKQERKSRETSIEKQLFWSLAFHLKLFVKFAFTQS